MSIGNEILAVIMAYHSSLALTDELLLTFYRISDRVATPGLTWDIREEVIAISVMELVDALPRLASQSNTPSAFAYWCVKRLCKTINNKRIDYFRTYKRYQSIHISGDQPINNSENLTLFMCLPYKDDYFSEVDEYTYNQSVQMLYQKLGAMLEKHASYVLGFWVLLTEVFEPGLDVPMLYLNGDLTSFKKLLENTYFNNKAVLMSALQRSQEKFMSKPKTYAQAAKRCTDYKGRLKKVISSTGNDLLHTLVKE